MQFKINAKCNNTNNSVCIHNKKFALTNQNALLYDSGQRTGAEEAISIIKSYVGEERGSSRTGRVQQMDAQMVARKEEEENQAHYSLLTLQRKRNGAVWSSVPSRRCLVTDQIGACGFYISSAAFFWV